MASSKRCCECKQAKAANEFHKSKAHGGLAPRCKPCAILAAREWYFANKEKKRAYDSKRRKEQPARYRTASKKNRQAHPEVKNADTSSRRRRVRSQMPKWVRPRDLKCFYESAARVSRCLGIPHHVDHIVPLRGKTVSGLHVPWNLQIIPAVHNLVKHNKLQNV